jgi:hypothetical protein
MSGGGRYDGSAVYLLNIIYDSFLAMFVGGCVMISTGGLLNIIISSSAGGAVMTLSEIGVVGFLLCILRRG